MLALLEERFAALELQRHALFEELRARPVDDIERAPAADSWSMRQVAQHLMLVEKAFLEHSRRKGVLRPPKLRQRLARRIMKIVFKLGMRVKAPSPTVNPEEGMSLDEIEARWDKVRETFRTFLDEVKAEEIEQSRFLHPLAGPLTVPQFLDFLGEHFTHHRRQLQRIITSLGLQAV